jgi:DNA-binding transcriptional LysR family regulator
MLMIRDFDAIIGFVTTVETGNFSAAAKHLRVTPSAVSKQIARLEARLAISLFVRNSRGLRLTEAGTEYYALCAKGIAQFQNAEEQISALRSQPSGTLNVIAPQGFGSLWIAPHVPEFLEQFPDVQIDLSFNYFVDVSANRQRDIIISSIDPPDESMIVRPLLPIYRVICAAPAYLERYGRPADVAALDGHNCLTFTGSPHGELWDFPTDNGLVRTRMRGNLRTNSLEAIYSAVCSGFGIAQMPSYIVGDAIKNGKLIAIFDKENLTGMQTQDMMSLYYPKEKHQSPKIRAFVEFLTQVFRKR